MNEQDTAYLTAIVEPLLAFPQDLQIERTLDDRGILLAITVNKEDMGKVIGQGGETARAIRRLLRQFGLSNQAHIAIKINEPK